MEEDVGTEESKCEKFLSWIRAALTFLVSHIGLCGLVVGYSIAGGLLFRELEWETEYNLKIRIKQEVELAIIELWNKTCEGDILIEKDWKNMTDHILIKLQDILINDGTKIGYDGSDPPDLEWTIAGAILYSIIVITTIGYGNIAPRTFWGKICTILYAIIGIPLMLLCMSNVGDAMAQSFKFIYWKVCCYFCAKPQNNPQNPRHPQHFSPRRFQMQDEFSYDDSHSSSFRSGRSDDYRFPDESAFVRQPRLHSSPVILNRYALASNKDEGLMVDLPSPVGSKSSQRTSSLRTNSRRGKQQPVEQQRTVPIWLCITLVTGYLCGGGALFQVWESWSFFESFYFCFITLTTIGFGDFVPGKTVSGDDSQKPLALCAVYLLFGMALLAMSFNLVQEQVASKVKFLGKRIGIISDEDEEDVEDDEQCNVAD